MIDTESVREANRIGDDDDLERIARRGEGFVADPFNRRWHFASCPLVARMRTGEPKWFAPDRSALQRYMDDRMAAHPTARPLAPCPRCAAHEAPSVRSPKPAATRANVPPDIDLEATAERARLRTATRVTFGPRTGAPAHAVRGVLQDALAGLVIAPGRILHAVFAGDIPANSDVENQVIYNVFDARANHSLRDGVRFELAPRPPDGIEYRYGAVDADTPFEHWQLGEPVANWTDVRVPGGRWDVLLSTVWWTLRSAPPPAQAPLPSDARFGAFIRLAIPSADRLRVARPEAIKNVVDGLVAAVQHHEASDAVCRRIAARLAVDADLVRAHLTDRGRATLGAAERPIGLTREGVQWNPDDTRLVAAELVFVDWAGPDWRLSASVAPAAPAG